MTHNSLFKLYLKLVLVLDYHCDICFVGLAKPAPVIETFCTDELVLQHVKLDGVVTLVDSKHAMQHLNEIKPRFVVNKAVEQIAYADCIIFEQGRVFFFLIRKQVRVYSLNLTFVFKM